MMAKGKEKSEKAAGSGQPLFAPDLVAITAIVIEEAGERGVTRQEIHAGILKKFPSFDPDAVESTVNKIVPDRITRDKFTVEMTSEGKFRKA